MGSRITGAPPVRISWSINPSEHQLNQAWFTSLTSVVAAEIGEWIHTEESFLTIPTEVRAHVRDIVDLFEGILADVGYDHRKRRSSTWSRRKDT